MVFPALLLGTLLALTILAFLLRDWDRQLAGVAALLTGGMGLLLWLEGTQRLSSATTTGALNSPLTQPLERFGFALALNLRDTPIVATALLLTALALVGAVVVEQRRGFVAFALALLTGYLVLALLSAAPVYPALLTPLFLCILCALSIFLLQAGRTTHAGGPLRSLIPPLLATPVALSAVWYFEQMALNPQDSAPVSAAALLIAVAFVLVTAPVPLHSAQPATAQTGPPLASALVTLLYQLAILQFFYRLQNAFPFLQNEGSLGQLLRFAGLATTLWGGLAAIGANHVGRLWGYTALHDWGLILIVLSMPGLAAWTLVLFLFALRSVSMMSAAIGLAAIERSAGSLSMKRLQGAGSRLPWASAAYLLGGLGLAGFPLSAGFTGHWSVLLLLAQDDWRIAAAVLIASACAIVGFIRVARLFFGPLEDRHLFRERPGSAILAAVVLVITISLAIVPQLLDGPIGNAVAWMTN